MDRWERVERAAERLIEAVRHAGKRDVLDDLELTLEKAMARAFRAQGAAFVKLFQASGAAQNAFPVVESAADFVDGLFSSAELRTLKLFTEPLEDAVKEALTAGALHLVGQLAVDYTFSLKNPRAVTYAQAHGAAMVRKIGETTRDDIRHIVEYALEHGWSYNKTALAISERYKGYYDTGSWWNFDMPRPQGHIDSRAHLIAVTEAGNAYEEGGFVMVQDMQAAGLEMEKSWSTMGDDRVSAGCMENQAEGWIGANQAHKSGDLHPLRFPGCRCDELYRVKEEKV